MILVWNKSIVAIILIEYFYSSTYTHTPNYNIFFARRFI